MLGNETSNGCEANPDIAGWGVLSAFVASALSTFVTSLVYQGIRIDNAAKAAADRHIKAEDVCEELLKGLASNQLAAGYAIAIAALIHYGFKSDDPHAALAYTLSLLSSVSQVLMPFELKHKDEETRISRAGLSLVHFILLCVVAGKNASSMPGFAISTFIISAISSVTLMIMGILHYFTGSATNGPLEVFGNLITGLAVSWLVILSFFQKFGIVPALIGVSKCTAHEAGDNEMSFGNVLAPLMLAAFGLPLVDLAIYWAGWATLFTIRRPHVAIPNALYWTTIGILIGIVSVSYIIAYPFAALGNGLLRLVKAARSFARIYRNPVANKPQAIELADLPDIP